VAEPAKRVLDPFALGCQELTCPINVHGVSLNRRGRPPASRH
jgi:hypothetical protein